MRNWHCYFSQLNDDTIQTPILQVLRLQNMKQCKQHWIMVKRHTAKMVIVTFCAVCFLVCNCRYWYTKFNC